MTKVRGWRKQGSYRAKWHDGRIGTKYSMAVNGERVVGFYVARESEDFADIADVVDIQMDIDTARVFAKELSEFINSVEPGTNPR